MRKTFLAFLATAALAAFGSTSARAYDLPVCLHGGTTSGVFNCDFYTMQQCRATASGLYAACDYNPAYLARGYNPYTEELAPRPRRARRVYAY